MSNREKPLQRLGGHLLILGMTAFIVLGWRSSQLGSQAEFEVADALSPTPTAEAVVTGTPKAGVEDLEDTGPESSLSLEALPLLSDTSLAPNPMPHTYQGQLPEHEFERYVVERGDTPGIIAANFGIQPETLLGGNPFLGQESSLLQTGVELIILPIDGVLHDVEPGENLENVAETYGVPVADIIAYAPNHLEFPFRLYPDTQIVVPGAVREVFVWTPPDLSSVTRGTSFEGGNVTPVIVGTGTFIYPVVNRNFTQYYWYGHQAIDIATAEGNSVVASDTGTITFAGWNTYGYGNLIVVNHGNGYETFYAHLSAINVVPGQIVYQGGYLGATGNTGRSSGPHIHFEIRINNNRDNPCWYLGC